MSETVIKPGYSVPKPVITQEECDTYAAMAQAVNEHNAACKVGDVLWTIADKEDCYAVAEDGTVPEPGEPEPTTEDKVAALQEENQMLKQCLLEMSEIVYA